MTQKEFDKRVDEIVSEGGRGDEGAIHSRADGLLLDAVESFGIKLDHYRNALNED